MAVGSGVILTSNGHILTNSHVVAEAQWIWVVLPGSTERLEAQVIGRDPTTDLAVLKIDRTGTIAAKFGNSDLMKPGDVVLAIGNAFGLSQTVTSGIVSATTRDDIDIAGFENYIQTDAPINPGNSGGALVNSNGEVIGINTAIFSQNGGNVGIGFAINGNLALKIAQKLGRNGSVERGYLGVTVSEVTAELANLFRTEPRGALVNDVLENSPASQAGFRPGDIIIAVNDQPISNPVRFRMAMNELEPHSRVHIAVERMGQGQKLEATLIPTPAPNATEAARDRAGAPQPPKQAFLNGIVIEELSTAKRQEQSIPATVQGVLISQVDPAFVLRSRLRPGMIICEVGGLPVDTVAKAIQARWHALHQAEGALLLRVWNPGQGYLFTSIRPE
jgi:serine protease Do